jgi:phosphate starvation-inducible PhoH-like protein
MFFTPFLSSIFCSLIFTSFTLKSSHCLLDPFTIYPSSIVFMALPSNKNDDVFDNSHTGKGRKRLKSFVPLYTPSTENQIQYVDFLHDTEKTMVVSVGPAGSGKTLFACVQAIQLLQCGAIKKIVITRPLVSVEEEEIGFLPGNLVSKMDPWTRPVIDIFSEYFSMSDITNMIRNNVLEIAPLAFMRGRTFHNTFVIADEMQNSSPAQMLMLATRIGRNSKLVVTGDLAQSDRNVQNGLKDFLDRYSQFQKFNSHFNDDTIKDVGLVHMTLHDVKRSKFVSNILKLFDDHTDSILHSHWNLFSNFETNQSIDGIDEDEDEDEDETFSSGFS